MISPTLYRSVAGLSPRDLARMAIEANARIDGAFQDGRLGYTYHDYLRDEDAVHTYVAAARAQLGHGRHGTEVTR